MQFNPVLFMGQLYFKKHWEIARYVYNFTGAWDLYSVMNFLYSAYKRIGHMESNFIKIAQETLKKKKSEKNKHEIANIKCFRVIVRINYMLKK